LTPKRRLDDLAVLETDDHGARRDDFAFDQDLRKDDEPIVPDAANPADPGPLVSVDTAQLVEVAPRAGVALI
jgi:hypothetical protein